jgi:transcriptional regulator with XRE-family HTH domain
VAENVTQFRRDRHLTLVQLSERTAQLGRGLSVSALSLIATGKRRVDVDDLMVLAVALEVPPVSLLMPRLMPRQRRQQKRVSATAFPNGVAPQQLFDWLTGSQHPLSLNMDELSRDQKINLMLQLALKADQE